LPISFYYKKIARLQYLNQKEQNPRNCLPRSGFVQQKLPAERKNPCSRVSTAIILQRKTE